MEQFPSLITNAKDLKRKKELENAISVYDEGIYHILFEVHLIQTFLLLYSVHTVSSCQYLIIIGFYGPRRYKTLVSLEASLRFFKAGKGFEYRISDKIN